MDGVRRDDPAGITFAEGEAGLRPLSAALEEEGFDSHAADAWSKPSRAI